ncbi:ABC transporter permease [Streptomyces albidoflavus]|uniref:ABC transporter permease n=1 Tax=Streptomyces albidoflavus TaxID=1886 RepID=UPI000AF746CA|nr:ABC transporter permease [Streptomyces albidoflavus]
MTATHHAPATAPVSTTHGSGSKLSWAFADSWTMTRRELAHWARQPVQVVVGLVFPVMMLLMFGFLIGGGKGVEGDFTSYLVPGMLTMTMAFGLETTMLSVTQDLGKGVIDRFRPRPDAWAWRPLPDGRAEVSLRLLGRVDRGALLSALRSRMGPSVLLRARNATTGALPRLAGELPDESATLFVLGPEQHQLTVVSRHPEAYGASAGPFVRRVVAAYHAHRTGHPGAAGPRARRLRDGTARPGRCALHTPGPHGPHPAGSRVG